MGVRLCAPALLLVGLATVISCDDDPTGPQVGSVEVFAEAATLEVYRDTVFEVVVLGTDAREVDVPVEWRARDVRVLEVGEEGMVTGKAIGGIVLVASAGGVSDSVQIEVTLPARAFLAFRRDSLVFGEGYDPPLLEPLAIDSLGREIPVVDGLVFTTSDPRVVTVGSGGTINVLGLGRVVVQATLDDRAAEVVLRSEAGWERIYTNGFLHACGIRLGGAAYCWGSYARGRLGAKPEFLDQAQNRPVPVQGGHRFETLTVGEHTTCGLTVDGRALCWGSNRWGQLGTGRDDETCARPSNDPCSDEPLEVSGGHHFVQLDVGENNTCGVDAEGAGWCWGDNRLGAVGVPEGFEDSYPANILRTPRRLRIDQAFQSAFAAGYIYSAGLGTDGRPYLWGYLWEPSTAEQLEAGCPEDTCWLPAEMAGGPESFAQVEVMYRRAACGLDDAGELYCWGRNDMEPRHIPTPEPLEWLGPNGLGFRLCGLTEGGRPYCVGWEGGATVVSEAFAPPLPREDARFRWIATGVGDGFAVPGVCGVAETNVAYCWEGEPGEVEPTLLARPFEESSSPPPTP